MHKEILTEEQNKLLTSAAMKDFALGRRNKWKDYVDLYFIIKDRFSVNKIAKKAADFLLANLTKEFSAIN